MSAHENPNPNEPLRLIRIDASAVASIARIHRIVTAALRNESRDREHRLIAAAALLQMAAETFAQELPEDVARECWREMAESAIAVECEAQKAQRGAT